MQIKLGVSRAGEEIINLLDVVHLLIGGTTGSGKSNLMHLIALQVLKQPNYKLFIIDMKRMEFAIYEQHAVCAYKLDKAIELLKFIHAEMFNRMDRLAKIGLNNVKYYKGDDMPYFVVLMDEISQFSPDLTQDSEERKVRKQAIGYMMDLACLARAVGIHMVCATQRPDRDVMPGQLKANFTARIALRCLQVNSQIILDNDRASYLPPIPGRCILQYDREREVQIYLVDNIKKRLEDIPKDRFTMPKTKDKSTA